MRSVLQTETGWWITISRTKKLYGLSDHLFFRMQLAKMNIQQIRISNNYNYVARYRMITVAICLELGTKNQRGRD